MLLVGWLRFSLQVSHKCMISGYIWENNLNIGGKKGTHQLKTWKIHTSLQGSSDKRFPAKCPSRTPAAFTGLWGPSTRGQMNPCPEAACRSVRGSRGEGLRLEGLPHQWREGTWPNTATEPSVAWESVSVWAAKHRRTPGQVCSWIRPNLERK